jgi:hypothetical protein
MLSTIKKAALCTAAVAALALAFSSGAQAQDSNLALGYYSNANTPGAPDGTLRLVNDGVVNDASPNGDLCAAIYVFDNNEEMQECCSCKITPNGYLALGVNAQLTANTLTGQTLTRGVIKVVTRRQFGGRGPSSGGSTCDPTNRHGIQVVVGIRGWLTHIEKVGTAFQVSVEDLKDSDLGQSEFADLPEDCGVAMELGSGQGVCSCTDVGR